MEAISSGCYVIDADYNVVSVNHTAHELYPSLEVGAKCYRCLMGEESPCKLCPVNNGVKGPRTYTDPIRGIVESVDAVEVPLEGYGLCHSLVFSTVGKEELFAQTLPTTSGELRNLALIGALTVDYRHVLAVDTSTRRGTIYRKFGRSTEGGSGSAAEFDYEELLDQWIPTYVHKDDRARVRKDAQLDSIERVLSHNEAVVIDYPCRGRSGSCTTTTPNSCASAAKARFGGSPSVSAMKTRACASRSRKPSSSAISRLSRPTF